MFCDKLKKYSVRVEYKDNYGSGVICKIDNNKAYILTAKHNFCIDNSGEDCDIKKMDISLIDTKDIKICHRFENDINKGFEKINVINAIHSKDRDISILEVKRDEIIDIVGEIEDLILLGGYFNNIYFRGYPNAFQLDEFAHCGEGNFKESGEVFEIEINSKIENENFQGFSGSGVFTNVNDKLYLVGLLIELKNEDGDFNSAMCLDLREIYDFLEDSGLKFDIYSYYKELENKLSIQLKSAIQKQKDNKKYIPDVFVELDNIKEKLRYLTNPTLFYEKIIEDTKRVDFSYRNSIFEELGFIKFEFNLPKEFDKKVDLNEIEEISSKLITFFDERKKEVPNIEYERKKIRKNKLGVFAKYQSIGRILQYNIEDLKKNTEPLNKKVILLTEKAGQGKTNLVCDFAENVIYKNSLLGIFLTGNEFNNLNRDKIEDVILDKIFGYENKLTFENFLRDIEQLCTIKNSPFTIIIDALNENIDIQKFSFELSNFVEEMVNYKFIRLIFTCRSEYFNDRFKEFKEPSFKEKMLFLDNFLFNFRMNNSYSHLKKRLIDSYFNFFDIRNKVFENVKKDLSKDFLLLRIFCEVYGHRENLNPPKEQVYDIYKDNLFKAYFMKKIEEINSKSNSNIKSNFKELIIAIIEFMLSNFQFINIPIEEIINSDNQNLIDKVINEDIIFRKDLINDENSVFGNPEVLNFTFDEFRDYLIADYLVQVVFKDNKRFENILEKIKSYKDVSLEGIQKYLFFQSKRPNNSNLLSYLKQKDWYEEIYINNIFSIDDSYITDEDIENIKIKFKEFPRYIVNFLIFRFNIEHYKNLNIDLLFEIIINLNEEEYYDLINPLFKEVEDRFYSGSRDNSLYEISKLIRDLSKFLKDNFLIKNPQYHKCFEFLVLLLGVSDIYEDEVYYETEDFLKKYIDNYPNEAKKVLIKYSNIGISNIQNRIWNLLNYCVEKDIKFSKEFIKDVILKYKKNELIKRNPKEFYFLQSIYKKDKSLLDIEDKNFIQDRIEKNQINEPSMNSILKNMGFDI